MTTGNRKLSHMGSHFPFTDETPADLKYLVMKIVVSGSTLMSCVIKDKIKNESTRSYRLPDTEFI